MNSLFAAHINTRSLVANFDAFVTHLNLQKYDVIGVTETWLQNGDQENMVNVNSYKFLGKSRVTRRGGGVGLYIRQDIFCETIFSVSLEFIECLWVKLKLSPNNIVIMGILYRPPNSDVTQFLNYLEDVLSNLYSEYDDILCLSDFNINMLNTNVDSCSQLESVFSLFNMSQIISEPTRVTANSLSIIDLIYTNIESIVDSGVIDANISDHFLTFVKVGLNVQKSTSISFFYRSIRRINLQKF